MFEEYGIDKRKEKFRKAFACEPMRSAEDFPVIVATPTYFGTGAKDRPKEYWEDPKVMLDFQTQGYAEHLRQVDDDIIPYFMPWFGTGVLASAFGCEVKEATGKGDDPAVVRPIIDDVAQIAKLKSPDPYKDGLMPKVLRFMEYAREHGELPVGPTDLNSVLCTVIQIVGYENLFVWMYEEPDAVHDLLNIVTDAFISWVKLQKEYTGEPLDASNGLQGVWSPKGVGVWMSDDDIVSVGPEHYAEFVVPCYNRIYEAFGGGSLHFCGKGGHQLKNIASMPCVRVINNSPLGNMQALAALEQGRGEGVMLQIQDNIPVEPEKYYDELFSSLSRLSGIMICTWALDTIAMKDGGYVTVDWDANEAARQTVAAIRKAAAKRFAELS